MRERFVSPLGLLNLYRHYFYDFGTLLGPPIEHIWLPPRAKTELIEVNSRTEYHFRETEVLQEILQREEEAATERSELSEQMEQESERDFRAGTTSEGGVNFAVWHASGTTALEYATSLKESQQTVRKLSRELSRKASTDLKRSVRTLTRASTEVRKESTRRHTIDNPTDKIISFEMRRKFQRIGVQVQHLGTQLAWQLYLDDPGMDLGLAELVHVAKPEDFVAAPFDVAPPSFPTLVAEDELTIPYPGGVWIGGRQRGLYRRVELFCHRRNQCHQMDVRVRDTATPSRL